MATKIYKVGNVVLFDGVELELSPLKIKYLREFMDAFEEVKQTSSDDDALSSLVECVRIAMKQYYPKISKSKKLVEDNLDMSGIYKVLEFAAGIKINQSKDKPVTEQITKDEDDWKNLDLAKLESEVFLLGIWKDYDELERSLSMAELMATLNLSRELDYDEKKFLAAMQGVDLDKDSGNKGGQKEWEDLKARVFSQGQTKDSNDVLALQGPTAQQLGFGIGMGLEYENLT